MPQPTATLFAPRSERIVTTNAWAFLHWLRFTRGIDLPDWAALQRFSAGDAGRFGDAIAAFARLPAKPLRLSATPAQAGAQIILATPPQEMPPELIAPLTRLWPPALLLRPLADALLHADLRPDDRVVVVGGHWPWLASLLQGTTIILAPPAALLVTAADQRATVIIAPAAVVADAAFKRPGCRPELASLRTILATGGPLSPEQRMRVYTWIKSDLMLLARTGDTLWGNPLEPVLARPPAAPGLFRQPLTAPAPA